MHDVGTIGDLLRKIVFKKIKYKMEQYAIDAATCVAK